MDGHPHPDLLDRALAGDGQALDELLGLLDTWLKDAAPTEVHKRIGCGEDCAIEIANQTLFSVTGSFAAYRGATLNSFMAWIWRILRRRIADHKRGKKCSRHRSHVSLHGSDVAAPDKAVQDILSDQEAVTQILEAVNRLLPEEKEVFYLHFIEYMNAPKIARQLNIPVSTARQRLHRAIQRVRAKLNIPDPLGPAHDLKDGTNETTTQ